LVSRGVGGKGEKARGRRRRCAALLAACCAAGWRACLRCGRVRGARRWLPRATKCASMLVGLAMACNVHGIVQCA
jgi:hypothetical protein